VPAGECTDAEPALDREGEAGAAGVVMAFVITAVVLLLPIAPGFRWQLGRRIGLW
jgi:hypothetical protein